MAAKIDKNLFWFRLKRIFDNWAKGGKPWGGGADALVVNYGSRDEEADIYSRSAAIHLFLFGYEFPDTVMVFTEGKLNVLCSKMKAKMLSTLGTNEKGLELDVLVRNKADKDAANFQTLVSRMKASKQGTLLGWLPKEKQIGKFVARWNQAWANCGMQANSVSLGFGRVLSVKDKAAIKNAEAAARFAALVFKKSMQTSIENACDEQLKVSHQKLSDETAKCFENPRKFDPRMDDDEDIDVCYDPLVMSGGKYDLRPSATNDEKNLDFDSGSVIICKLGARYRQYCSNVARTIFIDPSAAMEKNYQTLIQVYLACNKILKPGTKIVDIYKTATGVIKRNNKKLLPNFVGCGFGTGLEYRESNLILNDRNAQILKNGMVLNFSIGFEKLKDKSKTYAMQIADTILVSAEGPKLLTHVKRAWKEVAFTNDDDEDEDEEVDTKQEFTNHYEARRRRREEEEDTNRKSYQLEKEQRELAKRKQEELLKRLAKNKMDDSFDHKAAFDYKKINSYKNVSEYPQTARMNQVYVDVRKETILVPIFKQLVPFHISTIRSATKSEEGNFTVLRINFASPDMPFKNRNDYIQSVPQDKHFIQELTFKSVGAADNLHRSYFNIQELRKRVKNRIKEKEDKQSLVIQKELKVLRSGGVPKLRDLSVRPAITRRKSTGILEAHMNGLRFISSRDGVRIDIIYENIKHAVLQKSEKTTEVRMHFELENPIMCGKKKSSFIQFFIEVVSSSQDLGHGTRWHDADGLMEEQEERRRRRKYNKLFHDFSLKVTDVSQKFNKNALEFEDPFRQLAFKGVPNKEQVDIIPTHSSLVALDDKPRPFCLSLAEVDVCVLERVMFGLREFDLTFVFQDYNKDPLRITAIPKKKLESIKNWLRTSEILYYESRQSASWKAIMTHIREDTKAFAQNGAWDYFFGTGDVSEEGEENDDSASEFDPGSESEEVSEEMESDSEEVEEESDSDYQSLGSEEESGEDWDTLHKKAKEDDRRRVRDDDNDDNLRKKKKRRR